MEMAGYPSSLQRGPMRVVGTKQRERRSGRRLAGSVGAKPLTLCLQAHSRPSECLMRASRLADAFVTLTYVLGIAVTMRAAEALGCEVMVSCGSMVEVMISCQRSGLKTSSVASKTIARGRKLCTRQISTASSADVRDANNLCTTLSKHKLVCRNLWCAHDGTASSHAVHQAVRLA